MPPSTTQTAATGLGDFVQTFQIEGLDVRGRLVRLDETAAGAIGGHGYPAPLARLVGETMVLSAILGSALKYDGVFTLQAQGNGPVGLIMADMTSEGGMRAYANLKDEVALDAISGVSIPQMIGAGHLAFTVDQGPDTERYQGITDLNGATMAECAQNYFRQSEQLETAIVIVSSPVENGTAPTAAGLMVQRLPAESSNGSDDDDDAWRRAVVLMSSIKAEELLDPALGPDQLLFRLYHEDGVRMFEPRPVKHACRCSEARVRRTLLSFPKAEIADMAEDGRITVTCEFCRTDYVYGLDEIDALYDGANEPTSEQES